MKLLKLGIRREDKPFERRTPLIPEHVAELAREEGLEIQIQSSREPAARYPRCFSDTEYLDAGAQLTEQLDADLILGIKEIAISDLLPGKTYVFFSHTFKGQPYNMSMLKRLLALGCTMIDYEMIGQAIPEPDFERLRTETALVPTAAASLVPRTVAPFCTIAGIVGALDSLWALGQRLALEGHPNNPWMNLKKTIEYSRPQETFGNLELALKAVDAAGERLKKEGLPSSLPPVVVVVLGRGKTAEGALSILKRLPYEEVDPAQLLSFQPPPEEARFKIYLSTLGRKHTGKDQLSALLPSLTLIVNCVKWLPHEEPVIGRSMLGAFYAENPHPRLHVIGDVTCDPGGALEICQETFPDDPVYTYDPKKDDPSLSWQDEAQREELFKRCCQMGIGLQGPTVMAVTNLPCELPREASEKFSKALLPYVPDLVRVAQGGDFETIPVSAIQRATIVYQGRLTPDYSYLARHLRRVLVLGAGKVSPELLQHLAAGGCRLKIQDREEELARKRVQALGLPADRAVAVEWNVEGATASELYREFSGADLVVSILPPHLHYTVAEACLEARVPLVTASYTGKILELHERARATGVILLNEMGLDPGIDHVSALQMLRESRENGETVEEFYSYCGGLPAPEHSRNPLRYKFSWRSQGVLSAFEQPGRYFASGKIVEVPPLTELERLALTSFDEPFEAYANRDSLPYREKYGVPFARTFLRATLRYPGWGAFWRALRRLGWLDETAAGALPRSRSEIAQGLELADSDELVGRLAWLVQEVEPGDQPRAALATALDRRPELQYRDGEQDMTLMHHRLVTRTEGGERQERTATLDLRRAESSDGVSAMSLTTGGMLAIGAQLILDGKLQEPGVLDPTQEQVAVLVWPELEKKGIVFQEDSRPLASEDFPVA